MSAVATTLVVWLVGMVLLGLVAAVVTRRALVGPDDGSECRPALTPGLAIVAAGSFAEFAFARYAGLALPGWLLPTQIVVLTVGLVVIVRAADRRPSPAGPGS